MRKMYRPKRYAQNGFSGYASGRTVVGKKQSRRKIIYKQKFNSKVRKALEDVLLNKCNVLITGTKRLSAPAGTQGYLEIYNQMDWGIINEIFASYSSSIHLPSTTLVAQEFTITSCITDLTMKNQTTASVILDIYEITPRTDTVISPSTVFANSFVDQIDSTLDVTYGCTPYMANAFVTNWKILKKYRYLLAPGATEILTYKDSKNYKVSYEKFYQNHTTGGLLYFRGFTKIFFAILKAEPLNDSTTKSNINTPASAVDIITSSTYYFTYNVNNAVQTFATGSFGAITTGDSVLLQTGANTTTAGPV